jgi:hypothetical protein
MTIGSVSCNMKQASHDDQEVIATKDTVDLMKPYPELAERIDKSESTLLDNYFRLIISTDSTCKIEWGNTKIKRETNTDYHFSIARRFHLDWENEDFLVLKARTGSDAWFSLFLPLDDEAQESSIDNTLTKDEQRNLVVAEQFPGTDTVMFIYNLKTKESQFIKDNEKCDASFYHYCLDTVTLTKCGTAL